MAIELPPLDFDGLNRWNQILRSEDEHKRLVVATEILAHHGQRYIVTDEHEAKSIIKEFAQKLLDNVAYQAAMVFLLGRDFYDERSHNTTRIVNALHKYNKNALPGGSSLSKTFTAGLYHFLDWLRDPLETQLIVASTDEVHLKTKLFADLERAAKNLVVDFGLQFSTFNIFIDPENKTGRVIGVTYPQGTEEVGRFRGYHPNPRSTQHPHFGNRTRVRILLDEASLMPDGVEKDLISFAASMDETNQTQVTICFNPHTESHWTARICAPEKGIHSLDIETSQDWDSKEGFHVTRLDGKYCENVREKKTVINGMMTWQFYKQCLAFGESSPRFCTYARGFWPLQSSYSVLIPRYLLEDRKRQPLFTGKVAKLGAVDTAIFGDRIMFAAAQWGRCHGFIYPDGRREMFHVEHPNPHLRKPKEILWIEQVLEVLPEHRKTEVVAAAIADMARRLGIAPEWLATDSTGNGIGIYHWLRANFGNVLGIQWAAKASERKILQDDRQLPCELYDRVSTEMWYASKTWLEYDIIWFGEQLNETPLFDELSNRRVPLVDKTRLGKLRIETKGEYKSRSGQSPDCFVEGTLICTPTGDVPIEKIRIGDKVLTPFGTTTVTFTHESFAQKLCCVKFKDGTVLVGKGKHKIFTWEHGWIAMQDLRLTYTLESVGNLFLWKFLNLFFTKKKNFGFKRLVDIISQTAIAKRMECAQRRDFYTDASGRSTMALFLMAIMFIIKIITGKTIGLKIWSLWRPVSTQGIIIKNFRKILTLWRKCLQVLKRLASQRVLGTRPQRESHGIVKMRRNVRRNGIGENIRVNIVEKNSSLDVEEKQDIALEAAMLWPFTRLIILLKNSVRYVAKITKGINIITEKPVLVDVALYAHIKSVRVLNLTLEAHNAYYANGVLVQNCADSFIMCQTLVRERGQNAPYLASAPSAQKPYTPAPSIHVVETLNGPIHTPKPKSSTPFDQWVESLTAQANQQGRH